jgi:hypothetical protein
MFQSPSTASLATPLLTRHASAIALQSSSFGQDQQRQPLMAKALARSSSSPGNTIQDAPRIPAYKGPQVYRDRVTPTRPDFFRLQFIGTSDIDIHLRNRSASPIFATALNEKGRAIRFEDGNRARLRVRPNSSNAVTLSSVPRGTYYLQVSTNGSRAQYRLRVAIERACGCQ